MSAVASEWQLAPRRAARGRSINPKDAVARFFRIYDKKRGQRSTASKGLGRVGEAIFFGVFLALGIAGLGALLYSLVVPEWRANRHFAETRCEVISTRVDASQNRDGQAQYRPLIQIRYEVDGAPMVRETYDAAGWFSTNRDRALAVCQDFEPGKQYPCWYDPRFPENVVLARGYSGWLYVSLLVPISFIVIGAGGLGYTLYHWGTSAERRAALAGQAKQLDPFESLSRNGQSHPTVPDSENLKNSPGTKLAYRLPIAAAPGWTLFAMLVATLLWNCVALAFVVMAVRAHWRGEPDWLLTGFLIPFVAIGGGLVYYLVRQFLVTSGVGTTRIEISHHPLLPGGRYELLLSQEGRLEVRSLQVALACDERATFRQGTDTRTETQRVFECKVAESKGFEISHGMPFERKFELTVPLDAMHSFRAEHNEIAWKLVVRARLVGWPELERVFPLVVNPANELC